MQNNLSKNQSKNNKKLGKNTKKKKNEQQTVNDIKNIQKNKQQYFNQSEKNQQNQKDYKLDRTLSNQKQKNAKQQKKMKNDSPYKRKSKLLQNKKQTQESQIKTLLNFYKTKQKYQKVPFRLQNSGILPQAQKDTQSQLQQIDQLKANIQKSMLNGKILPLILPEPTQFSQQQLLQFSVQQNQKYLSPQLPKVKTNSNKNKRKKHKKTQDDFKKLILTENFPNYYIQNVSNMFYNKQEQSDFNLFSSINKPILQIIKKYHRTYDCEKRYFYKNFDKSKTQFCKQSIIDKSYQQQLLEQAIYLLPNLNEVVHEQWIDTYQLFHNKQKSKKQWEEEDAINQKEVIQLMKNIFNQKQNEITNQIINQEKQKYQQKYTKQVDNKIEKLEVQQQKVQIYTQAVIQNYNEIDWKKAVHRIYSIKKQKVDPSSLLDYSSDSSSYT